ncbi:sialate O-acetylesterase [Aurantiacibacter xanthus]|uniref:Sialate O-acetylesterase n=1 Tax=Aurantiacibacter xanthus TaxID=1784712 RepID=A0A3A1P3U4_9SPHN|nr:sialate O-acetylesterase [Aurantiacibacter xanthus]RIV81093.1 sialate O-acetylesterase [Aurantiacibacter xanthus]
MSARRSRWLLAPLAATAFLGAGAPAFAKPSLAPVWGEGAVIQRDMVVQVQGYSEPNARITGVLGTDRASTSADGSGAFVLSFPARPASADPIELEVTDADGATTVGGLVTGDVYLCSGQSNMAFTVSAGLNGGNNIRTSNDPLLRMLTVPLATAAVPARDFDGPVPWQAASPETTGRFSAACYYMLRALRASHDVPVGAIHASWGGSQIRAWLTPESGKALYGEADMAMLTDFAADPVAAAAAFASRWQDWYAAAAGGSKPWAEPDSLDWNPVPRIAPWTSWGEGAPAAIGNVWFRRTIELTPEQAAAGGTVNIGIIDDLDATWINGKPLGFNHGWEWEREYAVPASYLKAGTNELVFAASNSWDQAGMQSSADRLSFTVTGGQRLSLAEGWSYATSPVTEMPPRAPWDANAGIGVMHNRMIAPLGALSLKGAAWYQGESDTGQAGYDDRLRELAAGWRRQFGSQLQMLVVQLAGYGEPTSEPGPSSWADLREIEREMAVADDNAALVTAIDLGEWSDIHPANKVLLGERLALAAAGSPLPMPVSARIVPASADKPAEVAVRFSGVEGGLTSWSGAALGFELCAASEDSCVYAPGRAEGDSVYLPVGGQQVTRVRHAWADAPVVNVHDGRKIAIPGFELAVE